MARTARLGSVLAVLMAACGGSAGGNGVSPGPLFWGVPFVPSGSGVTMTVGLRNIDTASTTVQLQGYRPDGTAYTGPVNVTIAATSEQRLSVSQALGGDAPVGGWILASTPSAAVEVYFPVTIPGKAAEETSRAYGLPDYAAPQPSYTDGIVATLLTSSIQLSNASNVATVITVTPYAEPANPADPPIAGTPVALAFAPFETQEYGRDALAGSIGFSGSYSISAPTPFVVAAVEDLAFTVPRHAQDRNVSAGLWFGKDTLATSDSYLDLVMVVRNDDSVFRTMTITQIVSANGTVILPSPRTVSLAAHESRIIGTTDEPFDDLLGDVTNYGTAARLRFELQVPNQIDVSFRQFDPQFLDYNMTVEPSATGHVFDVSDVIPSPLLISGYRTYASILNRSNQEITVFAEAIITQPVGFDGSATPIATLTVPANQRLDVSPDGQVYLDRDGAPVPVIGMRFRSSASFSVTGWRERRGASQRLVSLSPLEVRSFDDGQ